MSGENSTNIFVGIPSTGGSKYLLDNIKIHQSLGNHVEILFNGIKSFDPKYNIAYIIHGIEAIGAFKARYLLMKKFLFSDYEYLYLEDDDDQDLPEEIPHILDYRFDYPVQFDYNNLSMKRYIGKLTGNDKFSMVHGSISVATLLPKKLVYELVKIIESVGEIPRLTLYDDLIMNNLILNLTDSIMFADHKVANYICSENTTRSIDEIDINIIYDNFDYVRKFIKYFNKDYFLKTSIVANSYIFYNCRHKILDLNPGFC